MGDLTLPAPPRPHPPPRRCSRAPCAALAPRALVAVGVATAAAAADVVSGQRLADQVEAGAIGLLTVSLAAADCTGVPVTVSARFDTAIAAVRTSDCQLFETLHRQDARLLPRQRRFRSRSGRWSRRVRSQLQRQVTCPPPPPPTPDPSKSRRLIRRPPPPRRRRRPIRRRHRSRPTVTPTEGQHHTSVSETPTPTPDPVAGLVAALAPLLPLDDGGPQPPTGTGGGRLGDDAAAAGCSPSAAW